MISAIFARSGGPPAAADHFGRFAEILRADRRGCNYAQLLHVFGAVVVESVNGAPRNAERLPRPHVDQLAVHGPRQHAVDAVDRLLVVVVAVRRRHQALSGGNNNLKDRDGAGRVLTGDQEAHRERPETDRFVGGIDA